VGAVSGILVQHHRGAPGSGKTTLAHQFVFANPLRSVLRSISPFWRIRHQNAAIPAAVHFFDPSMLPGSIRFINLSQVVLERTGRGPDQITKEVEKANPPLCVDSFRTMVRKPKAT